MLTIFKVYFLKIFALILFFLPSKFRNTYWLTEQALPKKHKKYAYQVGAFAFMVIVGAYAYKATTIENDIWIFINAMTFILVPILGFWWLSKIVKTKR